MLYKTVVGTGRVGAGAEGWAGREGDMTGEGVFMDSALRKTGHMMKILKEVWKGRSKYVKRRPMQITGGLLVASSFLLIVVVETQPRQIARSMATTDSPDGLDDMLLHKKDCEILGMSGMKMCEVSIYGGGRVETGYGAKAICGNWLNENSRVYSYGVGPDVTFEVDVVEKHGCEVYCFDPAINASDFQGVVGRAKPQKTWEKQELLKFHQFGLGTEDTNVTFFRKDPKGSATSVRGLKDYDVPADSGQLFRLETTMHDLGHKYLDVLKVDVEGSEFEIFSARNTEWLKSIRPRQIILAFHVSFFEDGQTRYKEVLENLQSYNYQKTHVFGEYFHEEVLHSVPFKMWCVFHIRR